MLKYCSQWFKFSRWVTAGIGRRDCCQAERDTDLVREYYKFAILGAESDFSVCLMMAFFMVLCDVLHGFCMYGWWCLSFFTPKIYPKLNIFSSKLFQVSKPQPNVPVENEFNKNVLWSRNWNSWTDRRDAKNGFPEMEGENSTSFICEFVHPIIFRYEKSSQLLNHSQKSTSNFQLWRIWIWGWIISDPMAGLQLQLWLISCPLSIAMSSFEKCAKNGI